MCGVSEKLHLAIQQPSKRQDTSGNGADLSAMKKEVLISFLLLCLPVKAQGFDGAERKKIHDYLRGGFRLGCTQRSPDVPDIVTQVGGMLLTDQIY